MSRTGTGGAGLAPGGTALGGTSLTGPTVVRRGHVRVMGGNTHLVVVAPDRATAARCLDLAKHRLRQLEARWSRFRPDSELSRLNASPGRALAVSADTRLLVAGCVAAWRLTSGCFDPTVLAALEELGYDRSFEAIPDAASPVPATARPSPGCAGIGVDEPPGTVRLPAGVRLDPGGIGKGLAADLVSAELLAAGALGACVNVSGDVRVCGHGPAEPCDPAHPADPAGPAAPGWTVAVEDPGQPGQEWTRLRLPDTGGAVASSSVRVTRWDADRHHLIDPRSSRPTGGEIVAATVVAARGTWADAATKVAFVAGQDAVARLTELGIAALLLLQDGRTLTTPALTQLAAGTVPPDPPQLVHALRAFGLSPGTMGPAGQQDESSRW